MLGKHLPVIRECTVPLFTPAASAKALLLPSAIKSTQARKLAVNVPRKDVGSTRGAAASRSPTAPAYHSALSSSCCLRHDRLPSGAWRPNHFLHLEQYPGREETVRGLALREQCGRSEEHTSE